MKRLLRRFVLGLPVVGAGSLVHMLLSLPLLTPVHWLARFRGGRSRRNSSSRDAAAVVIIILLIVGVARSEHLFPLTKPRSQLRLRVYHS